jgi:hypothetical protein
MSAVIPSPYVIRILPAEPQRNAEGNIVYPESDGQPMSNNTIHFNWISFLKSGFEEHYSTHPDVFVAGDLMCRQDPRSGVHPAAIAVKA